MTLSPYRSGGFLARTLRLGRGIGIGRGTGVGLGNTAGSGLAATGSGSGTTGAIRGTGIGPVVSAVLTMYSASLSSSSPSEGY